MITVTKTGPSNDDYLVAGACTWYVWRTLRTNIVTKFGMAVETLNLNAFRLNNSRRRTEHHRPALRTNIVFRIAENKIDGSNNNNNNRTYKTHQPGLKSAMSVATE